MFFMFVFKLPKVGRRLTGLMRDFFWSNFGELRKGVRLVVWEEVCRLVREGGLRVQDLQSMNDRLLTKWWIGGWDAG
jgi:hypothetical protein